MIQHYFAIDSNEMNEFRSHFLGKDKMIEALARNGVNIEMKNQLGQTALQYAVDNSNMNFSFSKTFFPISFRFCSHSSPIIQKYQKIYFQGSENAVKVLIQEGANVNIRDENGVSPLFMALHKGKIPLKREK